MATYKTRYARDWKWLTRQAAARRMLALSGDIHRNETDAFFTAAPAPPARPRAALPAAPARKRK